MSLIGVRKDRSPDERPHIIYAHDVARYPGRLVLRGTDALLCPIVFLKAQIHLQPSSKKHAPHIDVTNGAGTALYAVEQGMVANAKNRGRTGYGVGTHPIEAALYLDPSVEISYDLV